MNRDESIALWLKGKDAWNEWAENKLLERKALEDLGKRQVENERREYILQEKAFQWLSDAKVDFNNTRFDFNHIQLQNNRVPVKKYSFAGFIFPSEATFYQTKFERSISFAGSHFHGSVTFSESKFDQAIDFQKARFDSSAVFRNTKFIGRALFITVQFKGYTDFSSTVFEDIVNFTDTLSKFHHRVTSFNAEVNFNLAHFKMPALFHNAKFSSKANFASITSDKSFNLLGTKFAQVPDFTEAAFHAPPILDEIEIENATDYFPQNWNLKNNKKGEYHPGDTSPFKVAYSGTDYRKYRALSKLADDGNDYQNAMEAFANEIRCRRFWKDKPFGKGTGRFWFGVAYEKTSNFGRSFWRPLWGWLVSTTIFAISYALTSAHKLESYFDPIYISIRHGLIFSGLTRSDRWDSSIRALYEVKKDGAATIEIPNTAALLMLSQPLISAVFIFLFLLAVRNQFKIR